MVLEKKRIKEIVDDDDKDNDEDDDEDDDDDDGDGRPIIPIALGLSAGGLKTIKFHNIGKDDQRRTG